MFSSFFSLISQDKVRQQKLFELPAVENYVDMTVPWQVAWTCQSNMTMSAKNKPHAISESHQNLSMPTYKAAENEMFSEEN